jgi:hypothetical protein
MSKITLRMLTEDEADEWDAMWERRSWYDSLHCMLEEQCVDDHGAHAWLLELDPADGITFLCQRCPADVDYIYPDGIDALVGEFEVFPGYVLSLHTGSVQVNGRETYGLFTYGWRGPVTAELHIEVHRSYEYPDDCSVWIDLEAA